MVRDTQDNEPFSFITLEVATKNVTRWLEPTEKQKKDSDGNAASSGADQNNTNEHTEYVDQRLRELRAFERRARGNKN